MTFHIHTNKLDKRNHKILKRLPIFYQEILEIFNETKYSLEIDKKNHIRLSKKNQYGGNRMFQYKNETLLMD